ncbi:MAG: diaminopimelate epimerase [Planctomycetes bacterium]|nr:diaminopimelate epimerase [Planctomycetota bacterium]
MNFTKMQGIGNDYIYVDATAERLPEDSTYLAKLAREISDRHFGVGGDGMILITESDIAPFRMRIFNADGSEAEMCGNGLRCFAKYIFDYGMIDASEFNIETGAGLLAVSLFLDEHDKVLEVQINMGVPRFDNASIPITREPTETTLNHKIPLLDREFTINCVLMGNPHCVIFLDETVDLQAFEVEKYGSAIENLELFPQKTNVEFVKIISETEVHQRTWERGSGETLACGTGASAVFAVGRKLGYFNDFATIHLLGGELQMSCNADTGEILKKGTAEIVFKGVYYYSKFEKH